MTAAVAVHYEVDGFAIARGDLKGRHAAGHGFLTGLARHLPAETTLHCYTGGRDVFDHCRRIVAEAAGRERPLVFVPYGDEPRLAAAGSLFTSGPGLGGMAWRRRAGDQRAYSLTGVTHTICSTGALDTMGEQLLAPLQPWDAVVCTSRPARDAIEGVLDRWAGYLEQRIGARPERHVQLPVIPLGVDCARYAAGPEADRRRAAFRSRFELAADDVAVLFFGRLSFHAKAHPVAMYQALERAARRTGRSLVFLLCGRFPNDAVRQDYERAAALYAPSVRTLWVDGADDEASFGAWFGADLFLSLSDNIQETFGLTPIEAQAAGLPAVVSDWDGYKDTVADGETGFRIPTLIAPADAGVGADLMDAHALNRLSYDRYIGAAAMATVVDIEACADALARLVDDAELRRRMGAAGRARARAVYDWSVVVGQYRSLWDELAALRRTAPEVAPHRAGEAPAPLRDDPFRVFAGFATDVLTDDVRLAAGEAAADIAVHSTVSMNTFMATVLPRAEILAALVARAPGGQVGAVVEDARRAFPSEPPERLRRGLLWLLKLGLLRVER